MISYAFLLTACGGGTPDTGAEESSSASTPNEALSQEVAPADVPAPEPALEAPATDPIPFQDLAAADILDLNQRWIGDYDELEKRRFLRVLVPFSRTLYYLDAEQKGIAYEMLRELESQLPRIGQSKVTPKIVIIPTTRDRLLPALAEGYGDVAIGAFTVTDLRRDIVDFSAPTMSGIEDVVVTSKDSPAIVSEADLAGREIYVRRASSYYEDLVALNQRLESGGAPPVSIKEADAPLEDEDILQMVDAGIIPATVTKRPVAEFWAQLYDGIVVHSHVTLRSDGQIAWALRKDTPNVKKVIDGFVVKHRAGTLFGNVLLKRYLGSVERLANPMSQAEIAKYRAMAQRFRAYSEQYGSDWVLVIAQGYQESRLDQSKVVRRRGGCHADQTVDGGGSQRGHHRCGQAREQHPRRHQVSALPSRPLLRGRRSRPPGQRAAHTRGLQRGPGTRSVTSAEGEGRGPRPESVVRQRRGHCSARDRPRDRRLRRQHL